jgi:hypothetical protein
MQNLHPSVDRGLKSLKLFCFLAATVQRPIHPPGHDLVLTSRAFVRRMVSRFRTDLTQSMLQYGFTSRAKASRNIPTADEILG